MVSASRPVALLLGAALFLPALTLAQDDSPEQRARDAARERARPLVDKVLTAMERYGRERPTRPLAAEDAWAAALQRLGASLQPPPAPEARPEMVPGEEYELIEGLREALLERLRRLDPERYPPPAEPAREPYRLRMYEVSALLDWVEDHRGPNVGLGSGLDASGARDTSAVEVSEGSGLDPDQLESLVTNNVGEDLWDDPASIEIERGRLIVNQRPAVHQDIARFLAELKQGTLGLVEVELRLYRMPAAEFRPLRSGAGALSDEDEARLAAAVAAQRVELLSSHRVIAHDGQRVALRSGGSRSFVAGLDVDATGVVPVTQPRVNVLNLGLVIEVRPSVDRGEQQVLLDVALSRSELVDPLETRTIEGNELDLPRLAIARTSSASLLPLGRGALLGGLFAAQGSAESISTVVYARAHLVQSKERSPR